MDKFKIWLKKCLSEIEEYGLISTPEWWTNEKAIRVNCKEEKEVRQFQLLNSLKAPLNEFEFNLYKCFYEKESEQKFISLRDKLEFKGSTIDFKDSISNAVFTFEKFELLKKFDWLKNSEGIKLELVSLSKKIIKKIIPDFKYKIRCYEDTNVKEDLKNVKNITPSSKRQGASGNKDKNKLPKLTNEDILKKYLSMKEKYNLPEITTKVIDLHIKKKEFPKAVKAINEHVINKEFAPKVIDTTIKEDRFRSFVRISVKKE